MRMRNRDEADLLQLVVVRDTPVSRMAQHVVPICGEGAMAAVPDRTVRHAEPTPGVVTVVTVGTRLAPPIVLLTVSAKIAFVMHNRCYTGWRSAAA